MYPIMMNHVFSAEDQVEDFRDIFKEADRNHSGSLTIDEFFGALLKQGTPIRKDELTDLMMEFDTNKDMKLNIDEFVQIMTRGD